MCEANDDEATSTEDAAATEAAVASRVSERLAAVSGIIDTWRTACAKKEAEIARLGEQMARVAAAESFAKAEAEEAKARLSPPTRRCATPPPNSQTRSWKPARSGIARRATRRRNRARRAVESPTRRSKVDARRRRRRTPNANANANAHTYTHAGAKRRHVPLDVAVDAAAARPSYLWRSAESREAEARRLLAAEEKSSEANEAALAAADARAHTLAADLAAAEVNLAEARATATAADASREAAASEARATEAVRATARSATNPMREGELDATPPHSEDRARSAEEALAAHRGEQQSGQARALMLQAEASELRAKVEKRNREVRELNQMLKAWEAMRHSKDKQFAELVERCRKFEEEAAEKSRAVEAMRRRVGRERSGSGSIEHTPTSVTRSVGRSQRAETARGGGGSSAGRTENPPPGAAAVAGGVRTREPERGRVRVARGEGVRGDGGGVGGGETVQGKVGFGGGDGVGREARRDGPRGTSASRAVAGEGVIRAQVSA